jgi:thiopurine S-methyltransferase
MQPDFWHSRWAEGRIGFHEGTANALLQQHADWLQPARRIVVPLCGKAEDVAWLAKAGHAVVGVELVEEAVRAFFTERNLTPRRIERGSLVGYESGPITLWVADIFKATVDILGTFDGLYDRASLVALPEPMRSAYSSHLRTLLAPTGKGLVISFEYPQELMEGPPFSVPEAAVRSHFADRTTALLSSCDVTTGRLGALGARAIERCYGLSW